MKATLQENKLRAGQRKTSMTGGRAVNLVFFIQTSLLNNLFRLPLRKYCLKGNDTRTERFHQFLCSVILCFGVGGV